MRTLICLWRPYGRRAEVAAKRWAVVALLVALFLGSVGLASADKLPRHIARAEVIGIWEGYSADELTFVHVNLDESGSGVFAVSFLATAPVRLYRVTAWTLNENELSLTVEPVDRGAEPITFQNISLGIAAMTFELKGVTWTRRVTALNSEQFKSRSAAAAARIAAYRSTK